MSNMIYKTFRIDVKGVNAETGEVNMLIPMSTSSIDRDGESINPLGWKKSLPAFRKRPVLLSSHDYRDLRKQIGEFTQIKANMDGLFAKPKYYINEGNEEADWAFNLASKGMAAYSVGFIPKKWVDGDGDKEPRRTYEEQELLEVSHVVVPSNRDAIQSLRVINTDPVIKGLLDEVERELESEEPEVEELEEDANDSEEIIKDHKKTFEPHEVSQSEIIDEIDYLKELIGKDGLSDEAKESFEELMRVSGYDKPVKIDIIHDSLEALDEIIKELLEENNGRKT